MSVYRVGGSKSSQNVFPSVRPTLDLDFANTRTLDPRITFTRASGGSYVGADGLIKYAGVNEARFDHDPVTGECKGLLIEESRTNLFTYSEDFSNAIYSIGSGSISTNTITAPDGNITADAFIENTTSNAYHYFNKSITKAASSITYTLSTFVQSKGGRRIGIRLQSSGSNGAVSVFDLVSGTIATAAFVYGTGFSSPSSSIIKYPNNWYRIVLTVTSDTTTSLQAEYFLQNGSLGAYTGDGTSGLYIWGAQLEAGAFPTSYIPTQASTRTRARDTASITGKNFSDFYNKNESTVFVKFKMDGDFGADGFNRVFEISDGGFQNRYALSKLGSNSPNPWDLFDISNISELNFTTIPYSYGSFLKYSASFSQNNFTRYSTNTLGTISSSIDSTLPLKNFNPNQLNIGYEAVSGIRQLGGTISRFMYYPKTLTREQLQALIR